MSHASDQLWSLAHAISHQAQSSEPKQNLPSSLDTTAPGGIPRNTSSGGNLGKGSSPTGKEVRHSDLLSSCLLAGRPKSLLLFQWLELLLAQVNNLIIHQLGL